MARMAQYQAQIDAQLDGSAQNSQFRSEQQPMQAM